MRRAFVWCLFVAACSEPPPPEVSGPHLLYQVTREHIATATTAYAMDLNGDGLLDNYLGRSLAAIAGQQLGDPQAASDDAFTQHHAAFVLDVQHSANGAAAVNSYGGGALAYDPSSPVQPPLRGTADDDLVSAGPGDFAITIAPFGTPVSTMLHHAHVELIAAPEATTAVIAGGVEAGFVHDALIPGWANMLAGIVQGDCATRTPPDCGCTQGSPGAYAVQLFDANHDCVIDATELANNAYVAGQTFPDITLDGRQLLSFAFGIDATFAGSKP